MPATFEITIDAGVGIFASCARSAGISSSSA